MRRNDDHDGAEQTVDRAEVEQVLALVRRVVAHRLRQLPPGVDRGAFEGEAEMAVALALRTYRPGGGATFARYALQRVKWALADEARRQDPVGESRRAQLRQGFGAEGPTDRRPASLDQLREEAVSQCGVTLVDPQPGPEAIALAHAEAEAVRAAVEALDDPRERQIVRLRYWEEWTQREIAEALGVSSIRVHQLERRALKRLRELIEKTEVRRA
jgi:RNA polymerase sigma factor (sigma-70 family)